MALKILPLTPDLWPALVDLFGEKGACNGCWCMYWRIGAAYRRVPRKANKAAFHEVVMKGPPPGLIAFDADVAIASRCRLLELYREAFRQAVRVDFLGLGRGSCPDTSRPIVLALGRQR